MAEQFAKAWEGFAEGDWQNEVNVRNFIQKNYTPYEGDESFLVSEGTEATKCFVVQSHGRNQAGKCNPRTC